jgi:hypothetical protein
MKGRTGQPHGDEGLGIRGKVPSTILIPGKLPKRLSGFSCISAQEAGKMRMLYFNTIPRLPSEVPDSSQIIRMEKSVMFRRVLSSARTIVPSAL